MPDLLYRIIDALHGAIVLLLMVYVYRLLLLRREGPVQVRHLAGLFFLITGVQTLIYFILEEGTSANLQLTERISNIADLLALIAGLGMGYILYRNRHLYERGTLYMIAVLLLGQWVCYGICAAWHFADWTSLLYLPATGLTWGVTGWLIDRAEPKAVIPLKEDIAAENPFLTRLKEVLEQDRLYCEADLTRDEVCRRMLTNRTTFTRQMNEMAGMSFSEYLREMRLREAARLLRETDIPIDQIAYDVGLRSASGFHRNFLLSYGKTPKQYRIDACAH